MKRKFKQSRLKPKKRIYRKRNPKLDEIPLTDTELNSFWINLRASIEAGEIQPLIDAIVLTKTGKICTDCDETAYTCECEKCLDCKLRYCLCDWNLNNKSNGDEVRLVAWEFAKELLNKYELNDFYKELINQRKIPEKMKNTRMEQYILSRNNLAQHLKDILK